VNGYAAFAVVSVSKSWSIAIDCTAKDITQRKRVEEALRGSEARFRSLFTHAPEAAIQLLEAKVAAGLRQRFAEVREKQRHADDFVPHAANVAGEHRPARGARVDKGRHVRQCRLT
jgi:PAS domain-containing protein